MESFIELVGGPHDGTRTRFDPTQARAYYVTRDVDNRKAIYVLATELPALKATVNGAGATIYRYVYDYGYKEEASGEDYGPLA